MARRSARRRIVVGAVALAIFLVMSSFIGSAILAMDARAGGLDVEWRIPLDTGFVQMLDAPDGSLIVREEGGPIHGIDRNGTVNWVYDAADSNQMSLGLDGKIYFVERLADGNNSVDCLLGNGTLNWKFETDKVVQSIQIGSDGNIYFLLQPGSGSSLVCTTPDGMVAWEYGPVEGDLSGYPFIVFENGNVMIRSAVLNWSNSVRPEGSWIPTYDHLMSISRDGNVMWEKDILHLVEGSYHCEGPFLKGNSTPLLIFRSNATQTMVGLGSDGSILWNSSNEHSGFPGTAGPGNNVYYVTSFEDQEWGYPIHQVSRVSSINASSSALNWQHNFEGMAYGPVKMGDNASIFIVNGGLVKIGSVDGNISKFGTYIYSFSRTTILDGDNNCGLLIAEGASLRMIGGNGQQSWQFRLDSPVKAGSMGADGSVIVMTSNYVVSIGHPVLTTNMNYFVVLLAIDLFVTLISIVSIADKIWPQAKARSE
jgi:hypothetical protein